MNIPHIAFVGYSNSGKTTLAEKMVARFRQQGLRIGVIKHDAHGFQMDHDGKDSYRYDQAGADIVMIASPAKLNLLERLAEPEPLAGLLARIQGVDLIIIEGFKHEPGPKILVARTEQQIALQHELQGLLAIATTLRIADPGVPMLPLDDIDRIQAFIEENVLRCQHGM